MSSFRALKTQYTHCHMSTTVKIGNFFFILGLGADAIKKFTPSLGIPYLGA